MTQKENLFNKFQNIQKMRLEIIFLAVIKNLNLLSWQEIAKIYFFCIENCIEKLPSSLIDYFHLEIQNIFIEKPLIESNKKSQQNQEILEFDFEQDSEVFFQLGFAYLYNCSIKNEKSEKNAKIIIQFLNNRLQIENNVKISTERLRLLNCINYLCKSKLKYSLKEYLELKNIHFIQIIESSSSNS